MDYTQILLRPVVTEKATDIKEYNNQVTFLVHPDANKIEIRKAVEKAFDVKVAQVNVTRRSPQPRMKWGRQTGQEAGYKKAYVTLMPGEKIEFFEGV